MEKHFPWSTWVHTVAMISVCVASSHTPAYAARLDMGLVHRVLTVHVSVFAGTTLYLETGKRTTCPEQLAQSRYVATSMTPYQLCHHVTVMAKTNRLKPCTHTRLTALCPGLPGWASTRKVKQIWILLKQETEWKCHQLGHMQVCTSLQTDNHTSTPPLVFYRPNVLPASQPTASKHWRWKINAQLIKTLKLKD